MKRTKSATKIPDAINCSLTKDFTSVPNQLIRNPNISAKAKALLCLLLSNKDGWYSHLTTIQKMMKEKEQTLKAALYELETWGYLKRIRYRTIHKKTWAGSFWAYSDQPWKWNITKQIHLLKQNGFEVDISQNIIVEKPEVEKPEVEKPEVEKPEVEKPEVENQGLIILNNNNTNYNNIILPTMDKPIESKKILAADRINNFLPLAKHLAQTIQTKKNIKISSAQITSWANEIRILSESNKIQVSRIKTALKWYRENIGGEYIPVIESGSSLRSKFLKLEAAMDRAQKQEQVQKSEYDPGAWRFQ